MDDNPFVKLLELMKNEGSRNNPTVYIVAKVRIEQDEDEKIPVIVEDSDHSHMAYCLKKKSVMDSIKVNFKGITLNRNDLIINKEIEYIEDNTNVLLIPQTDGQKYFLICRL